MKTIKTVDIALVDGEGNVLLIERAKPPFMDRLVFPGGHVEDGETDLDAAVRELEEEVSIVIDRSLLKSLMKLDHSDRDPRPGKRESHVFSANVARKVLIGACAKSDARSVRTIPIKTLKPEMIGFDHYKVVVALRKLYDREEVTHESTLSP